MNLIVVFVSLIAIVSTQMVQYESKSDDEKMLLSDIKYLVFKKGQINTNSRGEQVSQLECVVDGSAGCSYEPSVVLCKNQASRPTSIKWQCEAELPGKIELGEITINCEGLDDENDPYINSKSCRLQYTLENTKVTLNIASITTPILLSLLTLLAIICCVFISLCIYHGKIFYNTLGTHSTDTSADTKMTEN